MRKLYPGLLGIVCCAFVLNCSGQSASPRSEADNAQPSSNISAAAPTKAPNEFPDSPGSVLIARESLPQSQNSEPPAPPSGAQQSSAQQKDQPSQRPVGTAAAEAPKVNGITAAQPAGVAIAPAKQRRVRSIVLKVGAIIGAGAAVGTVIALTAGTSSKPPGAH